MYKNFKTLFCVSLCTLFLFACGESDTSSIPATTKKLQSIKISVNKTTVKVGDSAQFTATGKYDDDSTANITSKVTWKSSTAKASVSTSGLLLGETFGTSDITAKLDSVTSSAKQITIERVRVYITLGSNTVTMCDLVGDYTLNNCVNSGATMLNLSSSIDFNHDHTFAYIANQSSQVVTVCTVDATTGLLSACADTGANNLSAPRNVVFNQAGDRAYIDSVGNTSIRVCAVQVDGTFTACADSGATGLSGPIRISMLYLGAASYTYINNAYTDDITQCLVSTVSGLLGSCTNVSTGGIDFPLGGKLNPAGTHYYFVSNNSHTVGVCDVNQTTGALSNCGPTGPTISGVINITINLSGTYALLSNFVDGKIEACKINTDGTLTTCHDALTGLGGNSVQDVGIY